MKIKQMLCAALCCTLSFTQAQNPGVRAVDNIGFDEVSIIEIAGNGDMWVGSPSQGVGFFNSATQVWTYHNTSNTPQLKSNNITALAVQRIGGIEHTFIGTDNGVAFSRISTGWDTLFINGSRDIKGMIYKPDTLMVFTDMGGVRYDSTAGYVSSFASPLATPITTAQTRGNGCGGYWVGSEGSGCFSTLNGSTFNYIDTSVARQGLVDNRVNVLTRNNNCTARLVGTKGGFSICPTNGGPCDNYTTANGLPQNDITAIAEDCQGRIWLGTRDSGMVVYYAEEFLRITTADGLPDNRVTTIGMRQQTCEFYIGTKDGNISIVDSTATVKEVLSSIGKINPNDIKVKVYPVPAKDNLHFVFDQQLNAEFSLTDINGREVYSTSMNNSLFVKVDVATMPEGMYFYHLNNAGQTLKAGKVSVTR